MKEKDQKKKPACCITLFEETSMFVMTANMLMLIETTFCQNGDEQRRGMIHYLSDFLKTGNSRVKVAAAKKYIIKNKKSYKSHLSMSHRFGRKVLKCGTKNGHFILKGQP